MGFDFPNFADILLDTLKKYNIPFKNKVAYTGVNLQSIRDPGTCASHAWIFLTMKKKYFIKNGKPISTQRDFNVMIMKKLVSFTHKESFYNLWSRINRVPSTKTLQAQEQNKAKKIIRRHVKARKERRSKK